MLSLFKPCSPSVGEQVAGDPQNLNSSLILQLESQICDFIQVPVGLLQGGAFRSHISRNKKIIFNATGYTDYSFID